jgi:hypothetical protein
MELISSGSTSIDLEVDGDSEQTGGITTAFLCISDFVLFSKSFLVSVTEVSLTGDLDLHLECFVDVTILSDLVGLGDFDGFADGLALPGPSDDLFSLSSLLNLGFSKVPLPLLAILGVSTGCWSAAFFSK